MKTNVELINYFHKALSSDGNNTVDFKKLNAKAAQLGYLVHPDCCTKEVDKWLDTLTTDYNSTFYKNWHDVTSKDRFELFIDQITHYFTTYGTDFQEGNGYVPNDGADTPSFKELKVIEPISERDLYDKCLSVVVSGIALKSSTAKVLCDFIIDFSKCAKIDVPVSEIKNREAMCIISNELGIFPSDEFGILRCLIYKYTASPLVIKSKKVLSKIKESAETFDSLGKLNNPILLLTDENVASLSKIFLRFKPIILAMKTKKTSSVINRIRKLAKKNHSPMKVGFWENLVSVKRPVSEISRKIGEIGTFKKVRLLQAVNVAIDSAEKSKAYVVRNGKSFVRMDYSPKYDTSYLLQVREILKNSVVESFKKKACKVKFPKNVNITVPSSEKSFVGNYPFGSSIDIGDSDGIVGIYWRNEWGTNDFDLSMVDFSGNLISWRSAYYNGDQSVVFSGDMTNADPCATELMYFSRGCPDSLVCVNQFRGMPKSKFRLFVANEKLDGKEEIRNYMVDPNNIRFEAMIDVDNETQKSVGIVHDGTLYLMDLHSGNRIVSKGSDWNKEFINVMAERSKCFVGLREILILAGFEFVEENPDIDLTNLEKDTIISLMTEDGK